MVPVTGLIESSVNNELMHLPGCLGALPMASATLAASALRPEGDGCRWSWLSNDLSTLVIAPQSTIITLEYFTFISWITAFTCWRVEMNSLTVNSTTGLGENRRTTLSSCCRYESWFCT